MFSCEFSKISKNTFFTEHLRTTASAFSFSEAATGGVLWKKVFLKISQNSQENTFGLRNFQKHLFYRIPLDDCFWLFRETLRKSGNANNVWKNPDEYSLPRNTNLRSIVQANHFFPGSINFQCMFSLVYTVYCQKQPPEKRCSVEIGVLKDLVKFIEKHLCWSLFLIKVQAWHLFWRTSGNNYFCTALAPLIFTYPFYFIFNTFFLTLTATTDNILDLCFWFKFKGVQRIQIWYLKSLSSLLFSFSMFFLSFSVLFHFFLSLLIKRIL